MRRFSVAVAAVALLALVAAGVGTAGREQMVLMCDGYPLTVTVTSTTADPSVAWGDAKISGGLHLIPVSFAGTFTDKSQGIELFSFSAAKGSGSGMHNQATITCTSTETGTAADLGGVPGIPDTDTVESDFTAVAVVKP